VIKGILKRGTALLVFAGIAPLSQAQATETCRTRKSYDWGSFLVTLGNYKTKKQQIELMVKPSALRGRSPSYLFPNGGYLKFEYDVPQQGIPVARHIEMASPYWATGFNSRSSEMSYSLQVIAGRYSDTVRRTRFQTGSALPRKTTKPETLDLKLFSADNLRADRDGLIKGQFRLRGITTYDFDGKQTRQNTAPFSGTIEYRISDVNRAYAQAVRELRDLERRLVDRDCKLSSPPSQVRPCFLTTATVETIGLSDDCWELQAMRKFRDGWLAKQPGGKAKIAAYYKGAPAICDRLRKEPEQLIKLYWTRIVPSALAAKIGANRLANRLYTRMVSELGIQV